MEQLRKVGDQRTIRFLSVEPLWEEVTLADRLNGISWLIVGGESSQGNQAEEFKTEWAEELREECRRAKTAFFLKQLGSKPTRRGQRLMLPDRHGGDWSHWPRNLRVRQMPLRAKDLVSAAGPEICGRRT